VSGSSIGPSTGPSFRLSTAASTACERFEGVVVAFDKGVGLGEIETAGGRKYLFHCTQITGGSRTIDAGTRVLFAVLAGRGGRWEAGSVEAVLRRQ
jgi:cold shock CspA family protein